MKRPAKTLSRADREPRTALAKLARDPLAAQVVCMLAGRDLDTKALIRALRIPELPVTVILDTLIAHGMVARRPGRTSRFAVDWNRLAPWFARMAVSPDTQESATWNGAPVLDVEAGEFGGWRAVRVWAPRLAKEKTPRLALDLGRHPAFHDLLVRYFTRLRDDAGLVRVARERHTLAGLAASLAKELARLLDHWHSWRAAIRTVPEQAWLDCLDDPNLL